MGGCGCVCVCVILFASLALDDAVIKGVTCVSFPHVSELIVLQIDDVYMYLIMKL
jgi:hypothetical protein